MHAQVKDKGKSKAKCNWCGGEVPDVGDFLKF